MADIFLYTAVPNVKPPLKPKDPHSTTTSPPSSKGANSSSRPVFGVTHPVPIPSRTSTNDRSALSEQESGPDGSSPTARRRPQTSALTRLEPLGFPDAPFNFPLEPLPLEKVSSRTSSKKSIEKRPHTSRTDSRPDATGNLHSASDPKDVTMYSQQELSKSSASSGKQMGASLNPPFARTDSVSSNSGTASLSARTMTSIEPSSSSDTFASKPFVQRNGRTYLNDSNTSYPLPVDLAELHRQSLRTLMLIQAYGAPVCCPSLLTRPPLRVLELGCGTGFWSMMCHRYFKSKGHGDISFTGVDIAPLSPGGSDAAADMKPDPNMKWKFVQHDLRQFPWPFSTEEFDLVMVKDLSLATPPEQNQTWIDEELRILRPGGAIEIWESDSPLRMLRPHVPGATPASDDSEEKQAASRLGAYVMTSNTPLSAPLNPFLVEYNNWLTRAFESRNLTAAPCPHVGPFLLQESEILESIGSKRLAIPLSEVRWEREGVGGVVTKDGKSYVEMKGKPAAHQNVEKKMLTTGQAALRRTALLTVVQQIQSLEPLLREVSGKSQDEWDLWLGKMMGDLMSESGPSWGECLEVGAWWARKKESSSAT